MVYTPQRREKSLAPLVVFINYVYNIYIYIFSQLVLQNSQYKVKESKCFGANKPPSTYRLDDDLFESQHVASSTLCCELLLLLLLLLTEIDLSLGGSSPYTSTDKTNKNKYT